MVKTPAEKWKDTVIKYRQQCQKILKISNSVRYAGVINAYGRTLTGIVRSTLKPLLKSEQVKNEFFIISTLMTLRKTYAQKVGVLDFLLLSHPKVTILAFQRKNITYYISVDVKAKDIEKIILKIKKNFRTDYYPPVKGMFSVAESKNSFIAAAIIITETKICKERSLISMESLAPTNPPIKEPAAKSPA